MKFVPEAVFKVLFKIIAGAFFSLSEGISLFVRKNHRLHSLKYLPYHAMQIIHQLLDNVQKRISIF